MESLRHWNPDGIITSIHLPCIDEIATVKNIPTVGFGSYTDFEDAGFAFALRYINEHACDPITTADVLKVTNMSNSTAYRRFIKSISRSIHNEIQRIQMGQVKELLTTTNLKFYEISLTAGFENVRYLTQIFRDQTGKTPTEYRRTQSTPGLK